MKTILCYGDSNTWGFDPGTQERLSREDRWPGVLSQALGAAYQVIEQGLPGRTTVWDDPLEGYKNGKTYLIPCLESHRPIDLVAIMLGTNDLKTRFSLSAGDVADGAGLLVDIVQRSAAGPRGEAPQALLLAPPPLGELAGLAEMFAGARAKSQSFSRCYARVAEEYGCAFLDTAEVVVSSAVDGVHLDVSAHHKLGRAVAILVKRLLENRTGWMRLTGFMRRV